MMKSVLFSKNKIVVLILALVIMADFFLAQETVTCAGRDYAGNVTNASAVKAVIEKTFARICVTDEIVENAGSSDCDWLAFSIGRYTEAYGGKGAFGNLGAYREALCRYVGRKYSESGGLHRNKATEWHRISLTLLACGGNPCNLIREDSDSGSVINLIADGTYNCVTGEPWRQGVNGAIYALITLDSMEYDIPDEADYTRDDILSYIISQELQTGGFSLAGNAAAGYDADVTAMAVQALAGYYDSRDDVRRVVDRSLACLQNGLGADATYGNASSTAQVLLALTSVGIDVTKDKRFLTEDGRSIIDGMMEFYDEDESMFRLTKSSGPGFMATTQCLYALTGWCRYNDGFSLLYDFCESGGPTAKPDTTKKPDTTQKPEVTVNPMQTQTPYGSGIEEDIQNEYDNARNNKLINNGNDTRENIKQKQTKNKRVKASRRKKDEAGKDRTDKDRANKDRTGKDRTNKEKNTGNREYKKVLKQNNKTTYSKNKKNHNPLKEDSFRQEKPAPVQNGDTPNGVRIIERDEAYVTEQELETIKGTDNNLMIDSAFDDTHRCLITINGADVDTCRRINLKASAGSGNVSYDKEIMDMASGAFIFHVTDDNGITSDALYSIATALSSGEYLLMAYADGEAEFVDKVRVEDGYLRFVIDRPGVYFVCREVKVKAKVKVHEAVTAGTAAISHFGKYIVLAVVAAMSAAVCIVLIMKGKRKNKNYA